MPSHIGWSCIPGYRAGREDGGILGLQPEPDAIHRGGYISADIQPLQVVGAEPVDEGSRCSKMWFVVNPRVPRPRAHAGVVKHAEAVRQRDDVKYDVAEDLAALGADLGVAQARGGEGLQHGVRD